MNDMLMPKKVKERNRIVDYYEVEKKAIIQNWEAMKRLYSKNR